MQTSHEVAKSTTKGKTFENKQIMKLFFGEVIPAVKINEEEQTHIVKVLRMRSGEEIFVTDGKGNLAKGNLLFEGKKVSLDILEIKENRKFREKDLNF